jgi:hypothetical protein
MEIYHYIALLETVLVIAISLGSYYGRTLQMTRHHVLTYGSILTQLGVFWFYMGPRWLRALDRGFLSPLMITHAILGVTTLSLSVILSIIFLAKGNKFDLKTLKYTRPLMIAVLVLWVTTYLVGVYFFITVRLL